MDQNHPATLLWPAWANWGRGTTCGLLSIVICSSESNYIYSNKVRSCCFSSILFSVSFRRRAGKQQTFKDTEFVAILFFVFSLSSYRVNIHCCCQVSEPVVAPPDKKVDRTLTFRMLNWEPTQPSTVIQSQQLLIEGRARPGRWRRTWELTWWRTGNSGSHSGSHPPQRFSQ